MKTILKPLEYTLEYNDNNAELTYEATNIEPFEAILNTFEYVDSDATEWRSKYNDYIIYGYEPFCANGFLKRRYLKFKSKQHIKFFLFLLDKHLDNIKQAQMSYDTNNATKEIKNHDEIN